MPTSKHRRKRSRGIGPASTKAQRQALSEQSQLRRREEYEAKRAQLLLSTYGPEPENGYDEWQRAAVSWMQDGVSREKAEAWAKAEKA
jgi:hypothetical protein